MEMGRDFEVASLGFAISHDPPRFRQQRLATSIVAFVSAPA
jgi:hypothetical protein